jgi:5-aminopentanamidase
MKVAIFQPDARPSDTHDRLSRLATQLNNATDVDLIVCPELFTSGYGDAELVKAGTHVARSETFAAAAELAGKHSVSIAYGYPEQGEDGQRYNSVLCISTDGTLLANHRKRALPTPYEKDLFVTGSEPCVFTLAGGRRAALLICYEVEFPEAVRAAAVAGAEVVIVPTALGSAWGVVARQVVPTRAFENGVFLMYANYAGEEGDTTYLGESVIVSPMGVDLARAGSDETLIAAELDFGEIGPARKRLPYLQNYQRF